MRHILFGDSIGFGVGDYQNGGWATQLRLFIDRQKKAKDHNLINLSISGDTTRLLLARFEREVKLRMRNHSPKEFRFLIAIGSNDTRRNKLEKEKNISKEEYRKNLLQLIKLAEKLCEKIVIIGLPPVDEKYTTPFKEQKYYYNQTLKEYNQIAQKIAQEKNLKFIDIWAEFEGKDLSQLFPDGLHPNTQGHQIIFEKVKKELFAKA